MINIIQETAEKTFKLKEGVFKECDIEIYTQHFGPQIKFIINYGKIVMSFYGDSRKINYYGKIMKNKVKYFFVAVNTPHKDRFGKRIYVYTLITRVPIVIGWTELKEEIDDYSGFIHDQDLRKIFSALSFKL